MMDILIVEDDLMLNQVMALQLSMVGIPVRSAKSGYEALKMIGEQIPNLLILDIGLPDLNGHDLVNMLRTQPATSSIPLIVHTSRDLSRDEQESLKLGPTRCVTKATAFSDHLETLVHELLNERATFS
ncbi:MAG: response regulator [Candidatus Melainabacteria bacterium]|nr:response regulator [Candidatus Melainabacteria bacterium]